MDNFKLNSIEEALDDFREGKFVIVVDDEDRENEGDFIIAAEKITPEAVNFMLKNGYLSENDVKGKKHYMTASGDIHEGTILKLKEVKLGDAVLKNIEASVVRSQKAPLLLGQSVLEKFGTITIDNVNSKLLIKQ